MDKVKRSERLTAMTRMLVDNPNKVVSYQVFCDLFEAAKSTVSEDVAMIQNTLAQYDLGQVVTLTGASGGVRFRPFVPWAEAQALITQLANTLNEPDRVLPGGFLYSSDLLSDPEITRKMGRIIARPCYDLGVDFVLTMETKGIPVAMMTAEALNVPLVIARRASRVYEGSAVNISFPDGKGGIESMSLSRRAVEEGKNALIVDDFTRNGGTALGMMALMKEFNTRVVGLSFVLAKEREKPLSELPEWPLFTFSGDGMKEPMRLKPAQWIFEQGAT